MATREKTDRAKHAKNGRAAASADLAGVNVALLKRLSETPGPSGREEQLRKLTRWATSSRRRRAAAIAR